MEKSERPFVVAGLLIGAGIAGLMDGIILILGIHHVHPGANEPARDIGYLIFGLVIALFGWRKMQGSKREQPVTSSLAAT